MIESANFDIGVVNTIKTGKNAIQSLNKQMNVDDIAELRAEIEDLMADNNERQEFFAGIANENADELDAELDELDAEMAALEMKEMDLINTQPIKAPAKTKPT